MKKNKIELDVDFIGGEGPLTKEDTKAISEYIRNYKVKNTQNRSKLVRKPSTRKKKLAI